MTEVSYKWFNEETGEVRVTKSWPEVTSWVESEGGKYETLYDYTPSKVEAYCMPGAAGASQRWKNYKF